MAYKVSTVAIVEKAQLAAQVTMSFTGPTLLWKIKSLAIHLLKLSMYE
jgi:hypothetical protein